MIQANSRAVKSANYDSALAWVKKSYPYLFHAGILKVELVRPTGQYLGLHSFTTGQSHIRIAKIRGNGVADYVSTIVHELVHALQYRSNFDYIPGFDDKPSGEIDRVAIEKQAEDLSTEAYIAYKKENNVPIWV